MLSPLLLAVVSLAHAADRPPMSAGIRYRSLWVPAGILDSWWYSESLGEERPAVAASVWGLEFAFEPSQSQITIFVENVTAKIDEGYWDDVEEPTDHTDGDWLSPNGLGAVGFGVGYGYEVPFISTDHDVWPAFIIGGGLGAAVTYGEIDRWKAGPVVAQDTDCAIDKTAIGREQEGCDPDESDGVWPVAPILDISAGFRVHIKDVAWVRIDAGVHDMLYVGGAAGGSF